MSCKLFDYESGKRFIKPSKLHESEIDNHANNFHSYLQMITPSKNFIKTRKNLKLNLLNVLVINKIENDIRLGICTGGEIKFLNEWLSQLAIRMKIFKMLI